jgi:hypothetical protein
VRVRRFRLTPFAAAITCATLFPGCFMQRGRNTTLISSTTSDYSPVVTFNAKVRVGDSLRVNVDRLRILAPGEVFPGMGASTGAMLIQALLVTANPNANSAGSVDRNGASKPWIERSASTHVRLSDSLVSGVPQNIGPIQFALAFPAETDLSKSWLVFRISGPAKAMPARMADGTAMPEFQLPDIRVFACAVKNLDGHTDKARAAIMKEAYSAGC